MAYYYTSAQQLGVLRTFNTRQAVNLKIPPECWVVLLSDCCLFYYHSITTIFPELPSCCSDGSFISAFKKKKTHFFDRCKLLGILRFITCFKYNSFSTSYYFMPLLPYTYCIQRQAFSADLTMTINIHKDTCILIALI